MNQVVLLRVMRTNRPDMAPPCGNGFDDDNDALIDFLMTRCAGVGDRDESDGSYALVFRWH